MVVVSVLFLGITSLLVFLIFMILLWRVISRFLEIVIAFYKDVVVVEDKLFKLKNKDKQIYIHRWKNTLLLKSSRISLAMHSLLEITMLFSLIYYYFYLFNIISASDILNIIGVTDTRVKFVHFVLYSIPVTGLNVSYGGVSNIYWNAAHIMQLLLSLVLIILSISSYIGLENKLSVRDRELYTRVKQYYLK
ncbi:hypothetical protein [Pontibacillus yanchengensis]|nr:hypothetical protein [Pontibacillus yanchengensis]